MIIKTVEIKELDSGSALVTYSWREEREIARLVCAFTTTAEAVEDVAQFYKGEGDWEGC